MWTESVLGKIRFSREAWCLELRRVGLLLSQSILAVDQGDMEPRKQKSVWEALWILIGANHS